MVIKGGARGGPVELAAHLERTDENERVTLIGIHGLAGRDVESALIEMDALGAGLRTSRTLYHVSINVGPGDRMTEENWQIASIALREKLDLGGLPYIEIEHEKKGRTHRHFVISRTDIEQNRAISDSHNYRKHEEVGRDLERRFGHERVQGAHVERDGQERPERTPSYAEMQQAKRTGLTPQEAKAFVTGLWQTTESGRAFNAALEAQGWMVARGDKRDFVLIDPHGETHSLARRVDGAKAKDVRVRMADIDPAMLPGVDAARRLHEERAAERAPQLEQDAANRPDTGRYDDLRETERRVEAERAFEAAAAHTTEPAAPIWDRDAETRAADENIVEAAIRAEAQKGRERPEAEAERETSPFSRGATQAPAQMTERANDEVVDLDQLADGIDAALGSGSRAATRGIAGLVKAIEKVLSGVLDFFGGGEPKLTRQQQHEKAQAEGNEETLQAGAAAEAEAAKMTAQDWQIFEQQRARDIARAGDRDHRRSGGRAFPQHYAARGT